MPLGAIQNRKRYKCMPERENAFMSRFYKIEEKQKRGTKIKS